MDLGAPIGTTGHASLPPRDGFDQGEHGAGIGLSGGHGHASAQNTQSGKLAEEERSGFNAGLGGAHASAGIPRDHTSGASHPIADKFMGQSGTGAGGDSNYSAFGSSTGTSGGRLDNSLDNYSGEHGQTGHSGHHHGGVGSGAGAAAGSAVSGAYEGTGTGDALTGQSHAVRSGAGVGPLGENLGQGATGGSGLTGSTGHHGSSGLTGTHGASGLTGTHGSSRLGDEDRHGDHHARDTALKGTAAGAIGAAGGAAGLRHNELGSGDATGSGHYSTTERTTGSGTGAGVAGGYGSGGSSTHHQGTHGAGVGAGAGAAGLGAGAAAATAGSRSHENTSGNPGSSDVSGGRTGHYGKVSDDSNRGEPISHPKDLDTGGPHSLVYDEATKSYIHRRDLK